MVSPNLIKFYTLPPSLWKYKWHPGLLSGKMLRRYSVHLRIYSWPMKYLPPHWGLRTPSLVSSGNVGRRQQAFLAPLSGMAWLKNLFKENLYGYWPVIWHVNHAVFFLCEDRGSLRSISIRQRISRRIRVDFKTSVIWHSWFREVNTSAIELIMIASTLGKGSNSLFEEVLYCRCLITNSNEHCINRESDHIMVQFR